MSQFGMQMPGGRARNRTSLDVFSVLSLLAVAFMVTACVFLFLAASKVGKGGNAFQLQEDGKIELAK